MCDSDFCKRLKKKYPQSSKHFPVSFPTELTLDHDLHVLGLSEVVVEDEGVVDGGVGAQGDVAPGLGAQQHGEDGDGVQAGNGLQVSLPCL